MKRIHTFCIILACCCAGCENNSPVRASSNPAPASPIQTALVRLTEAAGSLEIAAKVQPDPASVVHILPPASGRLIAIQVKPGDRIHKGDRVALIQSSDIALARADFAKAKVEAERSARAEKRAALLFQHEALAEKDYEDARAQAAQAQSELERTRQKLRMLGVPEEGSTDEIAVHAPLDGVVLELTAAPGELSRSLDNSTPLITIADLSHIWIVGDIFEKDLSQVRPGKAVEVTVSAYPGEKWKGRISSISDALDPNTRTAKIRVALPNPDHRLKPEMFASIRALTKPRTVAMLPASAVVREGSDIFVFLRQGDGENYVKRPVTLGRTGDKELEITSGLRGGETVVTSGAELIRNQGGQ